MNRTLGLSTLVALATWLCTGVGVAQSVQLKTGEILVGEFVDDPSDEGFTLKRFDTGGTLRLRWDQLSMASGERLKQLFSLSTDETSEVLVEADLVEYLLPTGVLDRVVGRVLDDSNASTITMRSRGLTIPIPRQSVQRHTNGRVPVLQVLTKDEYYQEQLSTLGSGEDADKHIALADLLLRVRDYDRAEQHLKRAQELGNSKQPAVLQGKIERVKLFQSAKAERDALDEIAVQRSRREFARGLELIAQWEKQYGNSKLKDAFLREKERFMAARELHLVKQVSDMWYNSIVPLAQKKATEAGSTLAAARTFAETELGKQIRAYIGKKLSLKIEEVDALWLKRLKVANVARAEKYYYGVGSFVLGAEAILKGTKQGSAEAKDEKKPVSEDEKRIEIVKRRIEEARRRAQQHQQQGTEYGPEDWWKESDPAHRSYWIKAYYAEHSGDLEFVNAYATACTTCGGDGSLPVDGGTGDNKKIRCPLCLGTRFKRELRAR